MIKALALTGPTASGKTALSIELAKTFGCEIISLDSMQIYKKMDIGTAKATPEEQGAVPHHMIDLISPNESFSAKSYKDMAMACALDITSRGKIPLFVGGTGLYLTTLLRPECEGAPESDPAFRLEIEKSLVTEEDKIKLLERLRAVDPESAESLHYNNTRRVIRALDVYEKTGKTKTYFDALTKKKSDEISVIHITLDFHDRENLYGRANARVDQMLKEGLLDEISALLSEGYLTEDCTALQAIGYKEMTPVVTGEGDFSSAVEALKQATRNYAKRQLTWFRHMEGAHTVFCDEEDGSLRSKKELLSECKAIFEEINK